MAGRRDGWEAALAEQIAAARPLPFGYGEGQNHCCLFAGNVVLAITGVDPIRWFRPSGTLRYRTERGAYALLRRFAGGGLAEAMGRVAAECGFCAIPPRRAGRGDVVLHATQDGDGLGICTGRTFAAVCWPRGLEFRPMKDALAAWRI